MVDFHTSTAERAADGRMVIAVFDGEPSPVLILRCSTDAAVALLVNVSLALADRGDGVP
jgi:hypothetical protein